MPFLCLLHLHSMATKTSTGREFLQLANTFDAAKSLIAGYYISEKLDGTRCFWDGGLTRGIPTSRVPWASVIDPKTGKRKAKIKPLATGLWSRYGNPIMATDAFLNALPCCPLDGELTAGRGKFQLTRSICGGDTADPRFDQISYAIYSSPPLTAIFGTREIKNTNMVCSMQQPDCEEFVLERLKDFAGSFRFVQPGATFADELVFLREAIEAQNDSCYLHQQVKLPNNEAEAQAAAFEFLTKVLDQGGEGCMIRNPKAVWMPKRHAGLLKFKPFEDAEAEVIGFVAGREGKQGNVLGKIGALKVRTLTLNKNVEFEIGSGLTFEDREFGSYNDTRFASHNPGATMPPDANGKYIRLGQTITFKYRELSDDGIPKEGRYWRKRDAE